MSSIVVLGSTNVDLITRVDRLPEKGETLISLGDLEKLPGGKGANQALAVGKLRRQDVKTSAQPLRTWFISCVGNDDNATIGLQNLQACGTVDLSLVRRIAQASTGLAFITVDSQGENTIVVSPGANYRFTEKQLMSDQWICSRIQESFLLLMQMELPMETILAAARIATTSMDKSLIVLNPAPMPRDGLPKDLVSMVDIIILNQVEAMQMLRYEPTGGFLNPKQCLRAVQRYGQQFQHNWIIVITLGKDGVIFSAGQDCDVVHVPAVDISKVGKRVICTVGAGDCWAGAFCAFLGDTLGQNDENTRRFHSSDDYKTSVLRGATSFACIAAALSISKSGAQESIPRFEEVEEARAN